MTKTDWAVVALNALTLIVAVLGLLDPLGGRYDGYVIALLASIFTLMVNGGWIIRRGSRAPTQEVDRAVEALSVDMDARQLLEIDQRLEALERRDEQRLRQLLERGDIVGPAAPLAAPVGAAERARQRA